MKFNPLDGDRAANEYDNKIDRNTSEKRWDAFYKGCQDKRTHMAFYNTYTDKAEIEMYSFGYKSTHTKKRKGTII